MKSSNSGNDGSDAISVAKFNFMVEKHDLTHSYSDDHRVWLKGSQEYDAIKHVWNHVEGGPAVAELIWNYWVLRKITWPHAKQFIAGGMFDERGTNENEDDSGDGSV